MLAMTAFQLGYPVVLFVPMKSNNPLVHRSQCVIEVVFYKQNCPIPI